MIVSFGLSSSAVICCSPSHDPKPTEITPPGAVEPFRHPVTPRARPIPSPAPSPPAVRSALSLPTRSSPVAVGHTALPVPLRPPVSCPPVATTPCPTHSELDAVARHFSQQVLCRLVEAVTLESASNGAAVWSQSEAGKGDRGRQGRSRWPREIEVAECDRARGPSVIEREQA